MGLLQRLGLAPKPWALEPPTTDELLSHTFLGIANSVDDWSVEELWADQPHLRTVTDFIARNVASVSLHVYARQADGGRERVRDTRLARWVKRSASNELTSELLYASILDLCLYDQFIWVVDADMSTSDAPYEVRRIPPTWIRSHKWADPWTLKSIVVSDRRGMPVEIGADNLIVVSGYAPGSTQRVTSPVQALRSTLREQMESAAYRAQLWRHGPRLGGVIERPLGAKWDDTARRRFKAAWHARYSGNGSGAGGVPVLEDGMSFKPFHLTADDEQIVEVTKLSKETVASIYHVNPVMVGLLDNANYSNVREFRKSLYGDSLGPLMKRIEDTLNQFLLPKFGADPHEYVEFNLEEKLRASFEEKAALQTQAVGAPWMTVNEVRAMSNLPAIEGGDDLIRPLNVDVAQNDDPAGARPAPDETAEEVVEP